MDLATVGGLAAGLVVVFFAIGAGGDFDQFLNVQGMIIVLGGTFASTMIKFPIKAFFVAIPIGVKVAVSAGGMNPVE